MARNKTRTGPAAAGRADTPSRRRKGEGGAAVLAADRAPRGTIDLFFRGPEEIAHVSDPIWKDISCVASVGRSIFCSCDETASIERLLLDPDTGHARHHESFALGDAFDLPGGRAGEMDIEGMCIDDGYLWLCGSHSLKRDKPDESGLEAMQDIDWDANRAFLGRVPLLERGGGVFEPMIAVEPLDGLPGRTSRMLKMRETADKGPVRRMLADDPLIGPFVDLPCKENGFDVEGLAVRGDTVLMGLRGPVVGARALILRMQLKEKGEGRLKPRRLADGRRYALQALDLAGQGIRDLVWDGDRLLVLGGATTDVECQQSVVAIEGYDPERQLYPAAEIRTVLDLPFLRGADHAEGIDLIRLDDAEQLLVTYDSPQHGRTDPGRHRLTADIFELAPR